MSRGSDVKTGSPSNEGPAGSLWWMCGGPVHRKLPPGSQAIIDARFYQPLDQLQQKVVEKGVDMSRSFLHQGNARPHTAAQTLAEVDQLGWTGVNFQILQRWNPLSA